jgi:hypothetical protein
MSKLAGYEYYKNKYNNTKPIRGRSVECRPLNARHRDWEQVVHYVEDGEDVYGARLYETDCVKYYPNGDIKLTAETWSTPITASFISSNSPFRCYKQYKKLWVSVKSEPSNTKTYPIPENDDGLMIEWVEGDWYKPIGEIKISKSVVDRSKAKDARKPVEPFLQWARMIHKLSDGWVMDETRKQYGELNSDIYRSFYTYKALPEEIVHTGYMGTISWRTPKAYEWFANLKEDDYMLAYMALTSDNWKAEDKKVSQTLIPDPANPSRVNHMYDLKFKWDYIKRQVWKLAEHSNDIHKIVEVEVGDCAVTGVV